MEARTQQTHENAWGGFCLLLAQLTSLEILQSISALWSPVAHSCLSYSPISDTNNWALPALALWWYKTWLQGDTLRGLNFEGEKNTRFLSSSQCMELQRGLGAKKELSGIQAELPKVWMGIDLFVGQEAQTLKEKVLGPDTSGNKGQMAAKESR